MRRLLIALLLLAMSRAALAGDVAFRWEATAKLPGVLANHAAAAWNDRIYVVGGKDDAGPTSDTWAFDPARGTFEKVASLNAPRHAHGVARLRSGLLVFGGLRADGSLEPTVEAFDGQRWRMVGTMPAPRACLGVSSVGDKVLVTGGLDVGGRRTADAWLFDPSSGKWTRLPDLPAPRARHAQAGWMVIGGEDAAGTALRTTLEHRDGGWTEGKPMLAPRKNFAVTQLGRRIIVAGGRQGTEQHRVILADAESLSAEGTGWVKLPALVEGGDGLRAAALHGAVYVVGGYNGKEQIPLVERGAWTSEASDWRVDEGLGFQAAFLSEEPLAGMPVPSLSLADGPDISNIPLPAILGLGFPLPRPRDADRLKLYLEMYRFPSWLDPTITEQRIADPLLLLNMAAFHPLPIACVKHAIIGPASGLPTVPPLLLPTQPVNGQSPQAWFDRHLPFSSLYIQPDVHAFHKELQALLQQTYSGYLRDPREAELQEEKKARVYVDDSDGTETLIWIPRDPMVFDSYRDLPMPQDPRGMFLRNLLLVHMERRDAEGRVVARHVFEVGSVVRAVPIHNTWRGVFSLGPQAPRKPELRVIRTQAEYERFVGQIPTRRIQMQQPAPPSDDPWLTRPRLDFRTRMPLVVSTDFIFTDPKLVSLEREADGLRLVVRPEAPADARQQQHPLFVGRYLALEVDRVSGEVRLDVK